MGGIKLDMLGRADDVCMLTDDAEASSELADSVADETGQKADVAVDVPKTETMLVHGNVHEESAVTKEEAAAVVAGCDHACEFCPGKTSKTSRGLAMHQRKWCTQAAAANDDAAVDVVEGHVVDETTEVCGPPDERWCFVGWAGFDDTTEKLHGTDPGDAWPLDWEPAAHVEGATDVDGDVATDVFWGRKKNVDEAGDHQDEDEPRCPHCDEECESQSDARGGHAHTRARPSAGQRATSSQRKRDAWSSGARPRRTRASSTRSASAAKS